MTVWHLAAELGKTEPLEKIWEWAKAELSTEELNNKLFLAKDDTKQTVWHYVSLWKKRTVVRENMEMGSRETNPTVGK